MVLVPSQSVRAAKALPGKSGYLDVNPRPSVEGPPEYSVVDRYSYASISSARTSPIIPTTERMSVHRTATAPDRPGPSQASSTLAPMAANVHKPVPPLPSSAPPVIQTNAVVSELFCAPDADMCIYSKDGILFRVYQANLRTFSSNFPDSKAVVAPDLSVRVPEHSDVLNILLQFMRNQRPPDLDKVKHFETVVRVALAVEKYEVHQSVQLFRMYMKDSAKSHPFEVFYYAFKCGNLELADQAAEQSLSHGGPMDVLRPPLRGNALLYYMLWREQFTYLLATLNTPPPTTKHPRSTFSSHKPSQLYDQCYAPVVWGIHGDPGLMLTELKREIEEKEEEAGGATGKGVKGGALKCAVCRKDWDVWKGEVFGKLGGLKKFREFLPNQGIVQRTVARRTQSS